MHRQLSRRPLRLRVQSHIIDALLANQDVARSSEKKRQGQPVQGQRGQQGEAAQEQQEQRGPQEQQAQPLVTEVPPGLRESSHDIPQPPPPSQVWVDGVWLPQHAIPSHLLSPNQPQEGGIEPPEAASQQSQQQREPEGVGAASRLQGEEATRALVAQDPVRSNRLRSAFQGWVTPWAQ